MKKILFFVDVVLLIAIILLMPLYVSKDDLTTAILIITDLNFLIAIYNSIK